MGDGQFQRMTIQPLDGTNSQAKGAAITVMFNPKDYKISKDSTWKEQNVQGFDTPILEWTNGQPEELEFELFFDGYEKGESIRKVTDKIEKLALVDGEIHRPPVCVLTWGTGLTMKCVLKRFDLTFSLFGADGTPLRGKMVTKWTEFSTTADQQKGTPRHSADHTKRRVVKQGDTLANIAAKEYDDPSQWRMIADANGIDDPIHLEPGRELLIPPII